MDRFPKIIGFVYGRESIHLRKYGTDPNKYKDYTTIDTGLRHVRSNNLTKFKIESWNYSVARRAANSDDPEMVIIFVL